MRNRVLRDEKPRRQRGVCGSGAGRALGQGAERVEERQEVCRYVDAISNDFYSVPDILLRSHIHHIFHWPIPAFSGNLKRSQVIIFTFMISFLVILPSSWLPVQFDHLVCRLALRLYHGAGGICVYMRKINGVFFGLIRALLWSLFALGSVHPL